MSNTSDQKVTLDPKYNASWEICYNSYSKRLKRFIDKAKHINTKEQRGFTKDDFPELENKKGHTSFRQIKFLLNKDTKNVIPITKTKPKYYVLSGLELPENTHKVTHDPMMVGQNYIDLLMSLKDVEPYIHDIKLKVENITLHEELVAKGYSSHPKNKGIKINFPNIDNNKKTVIVVYPNTIVIDISCTYKPLIFNTNTVYLLHEHLSKVAFFLECQVGNIKDLSNVGDWVITHQHLNKDGSFSLTGKSFEFKFKDVASGLIRLYSKKFEDGTVKPRLEQVQTPNISLKEMMKIAMFREGQN